MQTEASAASVGRAKKVKGLGPEKDGPDPTRGVNVRRTRGTRKDGKKESPYPTFQSDCPSQPCKICPLRVIRVEGGLSVPFSQKALESTNTKVINDNQHLLHTYSV